MAGIPRNKIRSALRRLWLYSPAHKAVKARARIQRTNMYVCAQCRRPTAKPEVDHKTPVGSVEDLEEFARRLFCPVSELQILCGQCHQGKTNENRRERG